jgi:hypothetical protein
MKFNKWTVALAAIGVVSLASAARADEATKMNTVQTALSDTTISGYVDASANWRPGTDANTITGASGARVPGNSFAPNDGFALDGLDLALNKPEDESPWAAGYRLEIRGISTPGNIAGNVIPQAYVTLRTPVGNGIDWKVGIWDTIVGYESSSDPLNPNYTRSYGYTIEPTTHTGILATYKINDMVTVQAGIADGSNVAGGPLGENGVSAIESQKAYMGDLQFTAPDSAGFMKGATLTVAAIDAAGVGTADPGSTSFYVGATIPTPVSALKVGACFDYLDIHNGSVTGNPANDSIWNIALYGSYQATEKLSLNVRAEYLDTSAIGGSDGALFGGFTTPGTLAYELSDDHTQNVQAIEELTFTAQYNLWVNVISRVEFRWDHVEHGDAFGANSATGAPDKGNDFLLALNLIYQF